MWTRVSVAVKVFDKDLAERCLIKGNYWVTPDEWSDEKIKTLGIGIDEIFEESRALLAE